MAKKYEYQKICLKRVWGNMITHLYYNMRDILHKIENIFGQA